MLVDNTGAQAWADFAHIRSWDYIDMGARASLAAAWNAAVRDDQSDYYAFLSSSCWMSGSALLDAIERHADPERGLLTSEGFHCFVLAASVFDRVGLFDENFYPAYYEDSDFLRRLDLAGVHTGPNPMPKVELNECRCKTAYHLRHGYVRPAATHALKWYYSRKWAGLPGHERWTRPFGTRPLDYWPKPPPNAAL